MGNDSAPLENQEQEASIEALCEEAGFPLAQVCREGDVLVLVPETLASLPPAEALQNLSDRIQNLGHRYVSFCVDTER